MKRFTGFFLLAMTAAIGCGGDDVDSQVSGVFPSEAFIGRQVRVEISGDQSTWSNGATVNFGDGITVDQVSVASPSALFADITIAPTAAAGLHDVTVTDGGETLTLAQSFELVPPVAVKVEGTLAQGSVAFLTINNLDFLNQFDPTTDADGNFVNTSLVGPPGTSFQVSSVDAFSISAAMLIDVDASSGPVTVTSGADTQVSSPGGDMTIAPRTAMPITAGTAATGTATDAFGTQLFEFTPGAGPALVTAVALADEPNANAQLVILGASGKWADGFQLFPLTGFFGDVLRQGFASVQQTPEKFYAIYFDNSGLSGYTFSMLADSVTLTPANEVATAHANNATAQQVAAPALVNNATLASDTEVDVYKVPVAAGDIGKSVHVVTTGAGSTADVVVEVFGGAAGTTSLGGPSDDALVDEDFTSTAIPAATTNVFVKVTPSSFFDATLNAYLVSITFE